MLVHHTLEMPTAVSWFVLVHPMVCGGYRDLATSLLCECLLPCHSPSCRTVRNRFLTRAQAHPLTLFTTTELRPPAPPRALCFPPGAGGQLTDQRRELRPARFSVFPPFGTTFLQLRPAEPPEKDAHPAEADPPPAPRPLIGPLTQRSPAPLEASAFPPSQPGSATAWLPGPRDSAPLPKPGSGDGSSAVIPPVYMWSHRHCKDPKDTVGGGRPVVKTWGTAPGF